MITSARNAEFLTINEISRLLNSSWHSVYSAIKRAHIKTIRTKKAILVHSSALTKIKERIKKYSKNKK